MKKKYWKKRKKDKFLAALGEEVNFRRKTALRPYTISTEEKPIFNKLDKIDRKFIKDTLRDLRTGKLKPEIIQKKHIERAKLSMPEPTIESMIEPAVQATDAPAKPMPVAEITPNIDRRAFIEGEFTIVDKNNEEVPFRLNQVQDKYYNTLVSDYGKGLDGAREIILKARQEGFSSLILALFAVDFITVPNSVSICISHNRGDTEKLFRKVHHYIEAYCKGNGFNPEQYLRVDTKSELENATNNAYFYIRTAGSKIGGRGGTATNIHFSEAAFFESTEKITATEIIEATVQQVPQNKGMIFLESTGGNHGTYFQMAWEKAKRQELLYKPRFFSWEEFYNDEFINKKRLEYQTEEKFMTDYPRTDDEAFIFSGSPYFDRKILAWMKENIMRTPMRMGRLATDGEFI